MYAGITNDLQRRTYEHRAKLGDGLTKRYNVNKLVYQEIFDDLQNAITRGKPIKAGPRRKKVELINGFNQEWAHLYEGL